MTTIDTRALGTTGMAVSAIGLGGGQLGDTARSDDETAERLILGAVELGVSLIDTAPSYGASERRIGRALANMDGAARDGVVVVTKGGYGVPGVPDWTREAILGGVERALRELRTDRIDVFLLHSCDLGRLAQGDLVRALEHVRALGKVRAIGYSGDGTALGWAVDCGAFDVIECSLNLVDQHALETGVVDRARDRGIGVIAKRALANAPWRAETRSPDDYRSRFAAMWPDARDIVEAQWHDTAIRFAAYAPGVSSALVGTASLDHLASAVRSARRGPLEPAPWHDVASRFRASGGSGWQGVV